jgi:FdhD protein
MRRIETQARLSALPGTGGMRQVTAHRIPAADHAPVQERCWVVEEQALFIDVAEVGTYTLMWTQTEGRAASGYLPADGVLGDEPEPEALALAAGFLFTEGMIDRMEDVAQMAVCPESPNVVRVRLADPARVRTNRRGGFIASSCGICGGVEGIGDIRAGLPLVPGTLRIEPVRFQQLLAAMESRQIVFNTTGGTHAAAIFSPAATLVTAAEDLGRHNALDKVIGKCLLRGRPTVGCGVVLSGRVSLEMIVKAARGGIEIVAAVSAPSSLAIEAAEQLGITLCGIVRNGRLTAFSHARRLG